MAIKGDFAKLARLQAQIKKLASDDVRMKFANIMGAEAVTQVQLGFRESRDPYGAPWRELALRPGGKPLEDTGRLRSSFSYRVSLGRFELGTNFIGARVHQYGATISPKKGKFLRFQAKVFSGNRRKASLFIFAKKVVIPRRQMVPEGHLGPIWSKAFHDTGKRFFSRLMKP